MEERDLYELEKKLKVVLLVWTPWKGFIISTIVNTLVVVVLSFYIYERGSILLLRFFLIGELTTLIIVGPIFSVIYYKCWMRKKFLLIRTEKELNAMSAGASAGIILYIVIKRFIKSAIMSYIMLGLILLLNAIIPSFILIANPYFGEVIIRKIGWTTEEENIEFEHRLDMAIFEYVKNYDKTPDKLRGKYNSKVKDALREIGYFSKGTSRNRETFQREQQIIEFCNEPKSLNEICAHLRLKSTSHVKKRYLSIMVDEGKLMVIDSKDSSNTQLYSSKKP